MALPDSIGPVAGTPRTSGIANANIQNNCNFLGSAIDNLANLDSIADVELSGSFQTAPTVGAFHISFLFSQDGTNYEPGAGDGSGNGDVDPDPGCIVAVVSPRGTTFRKVFHGIPIPPLKLKPLVANVDMRATGTGTITLLFNSRKDAQITD